MCGLGVLSRRRQKSQAISPTGVNQVGRLVLYMVYILGLLISLEVAYVVHASVPVTMNNALRECR